jgi:hypothetical protein
MLVIRRTWDEYIDGKISNVTFAEPGGGGGEIDQPTQGNRRSTNV